MSKTIGWAVMLKIKTVQVVMPNTSGVRTRAGGSVDVPLQWAEGMTGAIPVFASRVAAERYARHEGEPDAVIMKLTSAADRATPATAH